MTADRYHGVPAALPPTLPAIARKDAQRFATLVMRKFWPGCPSAYKYPDHKVRRVWISTQPTTAGNHSKGLGRLVHDMSHRVFRAVYRRSRRPHDPLHVRYETDIAAYVAQCRYLRHLQEPKAPKVKAKRAKPTTADKLAKQQAALARWQDKRDRAERRCAKLRRSVAALMRHAAKAGG